MNRLQTIIAKLRASVEWHSPDLLRIIEALELLAAERDPRLELAGRAMQALIAGITKFRTEKGMEDIIVNRPRDVSELACLYTDTLIAELNKSHE